MAFLLGQGGGWGCVSDVVKQVGVLSPIFFNTYLDVVLLHLKNQALGVTLSKSL